MPYCDLLFNSTSVHKSQIMKKVIEVLQYSDTDIRFNTDIDATKDPAIVHEIAVKAAIAMVTKLWGGNELSVLAMIRALSIADLAVSVNRKEMVGKLDEGSKYIADCLMEAKRMAVKHGIVIHEFAPGVQPTKKKS